MTPVRGGMASTKRVQVICQICGMTAPKGTEHWLDEPFRSEPSINVVRCPQHWSEWALRHTMQGRTKTMRARMRRALSQPAPLFPAHLSPVLTGFLFENGDDNGL